MKIIEEYENIIRNGEKAIAQDFCFNTFHAYEESRETGNELLNFSSTIWDKDISEVIASLRKFGISEFTISNTASGIIQTLAVFENNGAKLQSLVNINSLCARTNGETRPAFLMKII